uniref:Uncharacterized protein n=1 Tax=Ralstonia solanacearum TaxID=305 RepID=A0A0S4TVV7_RALSL|nr:protein of unknown function [Ralstonia solanacearum]
MRGPAHHTARLRPARCHRLPAPRRLPPRRRRRLPGRPIGAAPGPTPAGRSGLARRRVVLCAAARQRHGARDGRPHFNLYHYRGAAARGITRVDADGTLRVDLAPVPAVQ